MIWEVLHCANQLLLHRCVFSKCMGKASLRFWRLSELATSTQVSAIREPQDPSIFKACLSWGAQRGPETLGVLTPLLCSRPLAGGYPLRGWWRAWSPCTGPACVGTAERQALQIPHTDPTHSPSDQTGLGLGPGPQPLCKEMNFVRVDTWPLVALPQRGAL